MMILSCSGPQTRERIKGRDHFIALNRHYPGQWRTTIRQMIVEGNHIAAEIDVTDGNTFVTCVGFYEIKDGKIWRGREFWPASYEPPAGREQWVERST